MRWQNVTTKNGLADYHQICCRYGGGGGGGVPPQMSSVSVPTTELNIEFSGANVATATPDA